jgi:hypothetical protein
VVDCFDADVGVTRGGEQFKLVGQERHGADYPSLASSIRLGRLTSSCGIVLA